MILGQLRMGAHQAKNAPLLWYRIFTLELIVIVHFFIAERRLVMCMLASIPLETNFSQMYKDINHAIALWHKDPRYGLVRVPNSAIKSFVANKWWSYMLCKFTVQTTEVSLPEKLDRGTMALKHHDFWSSPQLCSSRGLWSILLRLRCSVLCLGTNPFQNFVF